LASQSLKKLGWELINPNRIDNIGYLDSKIIHDRWNEHKMLRGILTLTMECIGFSKMVLCSI
jgi:hypothetical protein